MKDVNFGHKYTHLKGDPMNTNQQTPHQSIFQTIFGSPDTDDINRILIYAQPCTLTSDPLNKPGWKRWSR